MMAAHMDIDHLARWCDRNSKRVTVEGKFTKASASYTEELAHEIACCFHAAVQARDDWMRSYDSGSVRGLENQFVNLWRLQASGRTKIESERHINRLEMTSLPRLAERRMARAPRSLRVVNFADSNVIRCAARSSSRALTSLLHSTMQWSWRERSTLRCPMSLQG